jgi:DNA-directed RNA polymerase subunit M/transcription elongation factor TFIIS
MVTEAKKRGRNALIILFCNKCGKRYVVEETFIGSSLLCSKCGNLQSINPASYSPKHSGNSPKPAAGLSYKAGAAFARYTRWFPAISVSRVFLALTLLAGVLIAGIFVYQSQSKATGSPKPSLLISTSLPAESKDSEPAQANAPQPSTTKQPKERQPQAKVQPQSDNDLLVWH